MEFFLAFLYKNIGLFFGFFSSSLGVTLGILIPLVPFAMLIWVLFFRNKQKPKE